MSSAKDGQTERYFINTILRTFVTALSNLITHHAVASIQIIILGQYTFRSWVSKRSSKTVISFTVLGASVT